MISEQVVHEALMILLLWVITAFILSLLTMFVVYILRHVGKFNTDEDEDELLNNISTKV